MPLTLPAPGFPPPSPDPRIRLALLRQFFEQSSFSLLSGLLLMLLQGAYAQGQVPDGALLAWCAAFVALQAVRWVWRRRFLALSDEALAAAEPQARAAALWGSAAVGVLWALSFVMNFRAAQPSTQMFCAMLACLTCVASVNVMAPRPQAFAALILAPVVVLAGLFLASGSWAGLFYAGLTVTAGLMSIGLVGRHAQLLHDSHTMRYERELLLADAQAARQAQVRFLAAASHDLRQPVHALGLLAAQAQAELRGRSAASTAAKLQGMALSLDALVDSLLDISRLDGGAVAPRPQALPLASLFNRLAPEFAVLADARGLQWRLRPTGLWVHSDAMQLERMLRNLLSNALRYTEQGGVLLAAQQRGQGVQAVVRVTVWDTGSGIAPEHQARIFDEFVQIPAPGRDRNPGHGLGLAIVARLGRLLDHPVRLRSQVGRGSCFSIELPWAPPQAQAADETALALPLHGRRVALVEDDPEVRDATAALLRTWGCQVWADKAAAPLLATLAAEGADQRPERVISDWHLNDRDVGGQGTDDGLAAIATLRGWAGEDVPALLLSGETHTLDAAALAAQGITVARKPLPAASLRAWLSAPPT